MDLPWGKRKWSNIVLIGMAGSGKSTVGRLLAGRLDFGFIDTDTLIEETTGWGLQEIVDDLGPSGLRSIEEDVLLSVELQNHVVATGGSSVYSAAGMTHLRKNAVSILLDVPVSILEVRIRNMDTRGLVRYPGQSFADLYNERQPLYTNYADIHFHCGTKSAPEVAGQLVSLIGYPPVPET